MRSGHEGIPNRPLRANALSLSWRFERIKKKISPGDYLWRLFGIINASIIGLRISFALLFFGGEGEGVGKIMGVIWTT